MLLFRMFNVNGVIDMVIFYSRMERDADFLHKKAERATLRVCLREKYRLPKVQCFFSFNQPTTFIFKVQKSSTENKSVDEYSSKVF